MKWVVVIFALLAGPALAGPQCGNRADISRVLAERYGEAVVGMGLAADGSLVEVYASETGSWTLVVSSAGQPSCLIASGQSWESAAPVLAKPGTAG